MSTKTQTTPQVANGATTDRLLRIKQVLEIVPVSKSSWWDGCRRGRFPKPIKLGKRTTAWRESDIRKIVDQGV